MTDTPDHPTEEAVRRALRARAREVTMSPEALDHIRDRRPRRGLAVRSIALAGVAAVVALLVGIAVFTNDDEEPTGLDVADPSTTLAPTETTSPPTSTEPPPTTSVIDSGVGGAVARVQAGLAVWPTDDAGAPTAEAAARGWVEEVLGLDPDAVVDAAPGQGQSAELAAYFLPFVGENGEPLGDPPLDGQGLTIFVATPDRGEHWLVESVFAESVRITLVERNGSGDGLRITGAGTAFEGTGLLWVDDKGPTIVALDAGSGEGSDFSVVVPWEGDGPVQLRLETGRAFNGEVPAVHALAVDPEPPRADITVVDVGLDDVLNMRAGPGVDNEVVFALDPFARALTHTGRVERVGDDDWWEIVTTPPESIVGWANSRYLSVQREVDADDPLAQRMLNEARQFLRSFGSPETAGYRPAEPPNGVQIGGIGIYADAPTPLMRVNGLWSDSVTHDWDPFPPEAGVPCGDFCVRTVGAFLDVRPRDVTDMELTFGLDVDPEDPNFGFATGLDPEQAGRVATVVAYVPPVSDEELDWRRYTFTFDLVDGTPTIRSVWRWGWTP